MEGQQTSLLRHNPHHLIVNAQIGPSTLARCLLVRGKINSHSCVFSFITTKRECYWVGLSLNLKNVKSNSVLLWCDVLCCVAEAIESELGYVQQCDVSFL